MTRSTLSAERSTSERDGWGELTGYLERSLLPDGIPAGMRGLRQL